MARLITRHTGERDERYPSYVGLSLIAGPDAAAPGLAGSCARLLAGKAIGLAWSAGFGLGANHRAMDSR
jgi:hypothetical protein